MHQLSSIPTFAATSISTSSLAESSIARQLGWIPDPNTVCTGYYLEQPFTYPGSIGNRNTVGITSHSGLLSQRSTSTLEGSVTITRYGQQITANKAYLYRDPATGKLTAVDMIGDVNLREPNSLIVGKKGYYNFETRAKSLNNILYRTVLDTNKSSTPSAIRDNKKIITTTDGKTVANNSVKGLTAWGRAFQFAQSIPNVYELSRGSFSTCPPINPTWRVKASHIVLDKNTGRGYATHARILVKNVPVFYLPYFSFSLDKQRKSGFLWPSVGSRNAIVKVNGGKDSKVWSPFFLAPFYWNIAPNYDMTITPGVLMKRGFQLSDQFRYLTEKNAGIMNISVLPNDGIFRRLQHSAEESLLNPIVSDGPPTQDPNITSAELARLIGASDTRIGLFWRDESRYSANWSSTLDFNYASDDYYLHDFGKTLNEISANYLLQEGDVYYKSQNWNFTGRVQAYQTLHPVNDAPVLNQYRRLPQLILNADYPDQAYGLDYFIGNEATHFDILKTPGTDIILPEGNRFNVQPGISLPLYWPYFYINPRLQVALTKYNLTSVSDTNTPRSINRSLPIFDIASGLSLDREFNFFGRIFRQTLEPQVYYTYIPYHDQSEIPVFDTTVNTLTYDQLFNYNRFTGIDRIGDANQIGVGVTTRLIDQETGTEKVRLGVGEIVYFANRRVTLCDDPNVCSDNPENDSNKRPLSPISGLLNYHINNAWSFTANTIWNPITKQLENTSLAFQYHPDPLRLINLGYSYARSGDILSGISTTNSDNNLKVTDVSAAWPLTENISGVARWSQNWNHEHLQNLVYGLQYDTCCWAVRFVGGRAFTGFDTNNNNQPQYSSEYYLQFSLKGLGDVGSGNPTGLLSSIPGYQSPFGQEIR